MDKNSFLKIPNEFVWNKDKGYEGTLLKEIGEKVIHVLMYIDCCQTRIGVCNFNINQMIQIIDMKVDSHKGKSIDQFKHIIKELQKDTRFVISIFVIPLITKSNEHIVYTLQKTFNNLCKVRTETARFSVRAAGGRS